MMVMLSFQSLLRAESNEEKLETWGNASGHFSSQRGFLQQRCEGRMEWGLRPEGGSKGAKMTFHESLERGRALEAICTSEVR